MTDSAPNRPLTSQTLRGLEESGLERALAYLPVLGWMLLSWLWTRRARPIRDQICRQLALRNAPALPSANRIVLDEICRIAKAECGWPQPNFLPEDELSVVFWGYEDGLDSFVAASEFAEAFGLRTQAVEDLVFCSGRVQQLIDMALGMPKTPTP